MDAYSNVKVPLDFLPHVFQNVWLTVGVVAKLDGWLGTHAVNWCSRGKAARCLTLLRGARGLGHDGSGHQCPGAQQWATWGAGALTFQAAMNSAGANAVPPFGRLPPHLITALGPEPTKAGKAPSPVGTQPFIRTTTNL